MTSLEALKNIKNLFVGSPIDLSKQLDIIEIALHEKNNLERKLDEYALALKDRNEQLKALEIIKEHKLLNYVIKNPKCAAMYHLTNEEIKILEEVSKSE